MRNKHAVFALFFPEPMSDADKRNLETSSVSRVQLFLGVAKNLLIQEVEEGQLRQLDYLQSKGVSVILRVEEPDPGKRAGSYYDEVNHPTIAADIQAVRQHVEVEAVIVGNEPQGFYNLKRGSPNWGNQPEPEYPDKGGRASAHRHALGKLRTALQAGGLKVVSPGYKRGRVRPEQPPEPGNATWARECLLEYNKCDAGGCHVYEDSWASVEDENRYKWAVGEELERVHTEVWINETNINTRQATDVERMRAILAMYDLLAAQPWTDGVITSFCFFVSNGLANQEWSHQIVRDPAAYALLEQWMGD